MTVQNCLKKCMTNYTHYQEYFKNFLGAWSFANGDEVLTIKSVGEEEMFDAQTGEKKSGLCIRFNEKELPMVLNVTNASTIADVTGTDVVNEWIGKQVIVGASKVRAFGKETPAIRVRPERPKPKVNGRPASDAQIARIEALIRDGQVKENAMLKFYGVQTVAQLSNDQARALIITKTGEEIN